VLLFVRFLGLDHTLVAPPPVGNWGKASGGSGEEQAARDAFLVLNPLGQVPVLVDPNTEDGTPLVLRDSAAIVTYLARRYAPNAGWAPNEALPAAQVAQWLAYSAHEVTQSLLKVRVALLFDWDIEPLTVEAALEASRTVLAYLDSQLLGGEARGQEWLVPGQHPTIADVCVYPYVAFANGSSKGALNLAQHPALSRWLARFAALPGYVAMPGL
jgi:glutathione S-transferase